MSRGIEQLVIDLLSEANDEGGFPASLVCTTEGLPIASSGTLPTDDLSAFTALFEDVVERARRDLGLEGVDEVTLRDPGFGRYVVRPLAFDGRTRAFLVAHVPTNRTWRRLTTRVSARLVETLQPLMAAELVP